MTFVFIGVSLVLFITLYFRSKKSRKDHSKSQGDRHNKFRQYVIENWNQIKVNTNDCSFINYDTTVNKNTPISRLNNNEESFIEWSSDNVHRVDLEEIKRTKLICNYSSGDSGSKNKKAFSVLVDKDITIVEFKVRLKDYIYVYYPDNINSENYYIDLDFLEEDIDSALFN